MGSVCEEQPPNPPFLRNRQQVDGFSGEERPLAVVEVPADRCARDRWLLCARSREEVLLLRSRV